MSKDGAAIVQPKWNAGLEFQRLRITASGLERVEACPASASLPAVFSTTDASERGTVIHRFLENILRGRHPKLCVAQTPARYREIVSRIDVARVRGQFDTENATVDVEPAYSFNIFSGEVRHLGSGIGRAYPEPKSGDIFGTTDVAGVSWWDGVDVVVDWKAGFDEVPPPEENLQIGFAAFARATLRRKTEVEGRVGYVRPSGAIDYVPHVFNSFELHGIEDRLVSIYERAKAAQVSLANGEAPKLHVGPWCKYCPALTACPAQMDLVRAMGSTVNSIDRRIYALTPEEQGLAWVRVEAVLRTAQRIKDVLKDAAALQPIPVDNDREVREVTLQRKHFDREGALTMLRAKGATAEELASLEPTVPVKQVRVCLLKKRSLRR